MNKKAFIKHFPVSLGLLIYKKLYGKTDEEMRHLFEKETKQQ